MDYSWLWIPLFFGFIVIGVTARYVRARRKGLRGMQAFREGLMPVSILMQGESVRSGLPVTQIDVADKPDQKEKNL